MKTAISSAGPGIESQVDTRFGRCAYFVIVNVEGNEIKEEKSIENPGVNMPGGAGISAAQFVANEKVKAVVSGNVGPKAFYVLNSLGIEIYQAVPGTVKENAEKLLRNELQKIDSGSGGGFARGRGFGRRF
ncbi:MAG: hypothetical protein DRP13_04020 [Candidatus Aenigmatarchaeota archaeon]|nr:MAG: hypothetical protein DRP13_04020 [Candidatus Aenigmarchaeota archaeon]